MGERAPLRLKGPFVDVGLITLVSGRLFRVCCKKAAASEVLKAVPMCRAFQVNERVSVHIAAKSAAENVLSCSHRQFYLLFIHTSSKCPCFVFSGASGILQVA